MVRGFLAPSCLRVSIRVGVQVVEVNVLWSELARRGVHIWAVATVGDIVPASLRLVGEEDVCPVLPAEPPGHLVSEGEHVFCGVLVHPVVKRTVAVGGMDVDVTREASLKAREHTVER